MTLGTNDMETAQSLNLRGHRCVRRITTKNNVDTTTSHVGGKRNSTLTTGLSDNFSFLFVVFSVQHLVRHARGAQKLGQQFVLINRHRTDQNRLALFMALLHFLHDCEPLPFLGAINTIGKIGTLVIAVSWDLRNFKLINLFKFLSLSRGRTGHTRQLGVETEIVLEGNRRHRFTFTLDLYALFGFYSLVEAFRIAATFHHATGKLVYDNDLAITNNIILILLEKRLSAQRLLGMVNHLQTLLVKIGDTKSLLDLLQTRLSKRRNTHLLIEVVIFVFDKRLRDLGKLVIQIRRLLGSGRDNERRTGFVNQDRVNFVDHSVVQTTLHEILRSLRHVVAQVIKTKFVIRSEGDVRIVSFFTRSRTQVIHLDTERLHTRLNFIASSPSHGGVRGGGRFFNGSFIRFIVPITALVLNTTNRQT